MDDSLARGMARALLAGMDAPSVKEIADALWVAQVIGRSASNAAPRKRRTPPAPSLQRRTQRLRLYDLPGNDQDSRTAGRWLSRLRHPFSARRNRTTDADRPFTPTPPAIPLYPVLAREHGQGDGSIAWRGV